MQNKDKRVLWLLNHTTLREFEVPLLVSLGFEVYTPKQFPVDDENLSASVTYHYDATLSIPEAVINILDAHDFYEDPITPQIARLINTYFGIAFFAFFPVLMEELVKHFQGFLFLRIFGLSAKLSYTDLITQIFDENFFDALKVIKKRFWFAQAYDHLIEIEGNLLKNCGLNLPLGLPNSYFQNENSWIGDKNQVLFVCPRIESSPTYYGEIYKKFKQHFGNLPHIIAGNQPIAVNDPAVKGFQPREQFNQWLIHCKVMFYHSQEARHLHYHLLEAILFGMPVIYMRGGILEKLGGENQPGACATFKEAREKIEKILNNNNELIQVILREQNKLLNSFKFDTIQAIWKKNFVEKMIHSSFKTTAKIFTIGVFLPVGYLGGSLRGAKNIAKMLKLGSQAAGTPIKVVFSYVGGTYDASTEFSDLREIGISTRETHWEILNGQKYNIANSFEGVPLQEEKKSYLLPTDGICNFNDCDFWLLISDRTFPTIAPLKPYGVVIYDYIQRYFPAITGSNYVEYRTFEMERIRVARNAQFVMVTTPQTRDDAIQYAGLNANKVILMPLEFSPLGLPNESNHNASHFIWTTNISPHKNHLNALQALEIYYQEYKGQYKVAITGFNTLLFDKKITNNPYVDQIRSYITSSPILKQKLNFLGNLSEVAYLQTLSQAKFLWHPTRIDNGTFSVIEAAYYQVPSLSSDYPQMRYIDERFQLNLLFSDPLSAKDMAKKLAFMEANLAVRKSLLPEKNYLEQFTYQNLATEFWQLIKEWL